MKIIRQKRKTLKRERIFPLLARSWLCMFGVIDFHDRALEYLALFCPKKSIASHNNTEIVTALGLTFLYPARIGIIFKLNSLLFYVEFLRILFYNSNTGLLSNMWSSNVFSLSVSSISLS